MLAQVEGRAKMLTKISEPPGQLLRWEIPRSTGGPGVSQVQEPLWPRRNYKIPKRRNPETPEHEGT